MVGIEFIYMQNHLIIILNEFFAENYGEQNSWKFGDIHLVLYLTPKVLWDEF